MDKRYEKLELYTDIIQKDHVAMDEKIADMDKMLSTLEEIIDHVGMTSKERIAAVKSR